MVSAGLTLTMATCAWAAEFGNDVQLRAMWDEMLRAKTLQVAGLDKTYFVRYAISDTEEVSAAASLGGLDSFRHDHARVPSMEIRVGSYQFDNTNSIYANRMSAGMAPLDDNYLALRETLWLASDAFYKLAAVRITSKRNALRDVADPDTTPDFANAKPLVLLRPEQHLQVDGTAWQDELRRLSKRFEAHPDILHSRVRFQSAASTYRVTTSEGSVIRIPQGFTDFEVEASALAPDGRPVHDSYLLALQEASQLPAEAELNRAIDAMGASTDALRNAPMAEDYTGPVLFEAQAAAQLMAELMTDAARLHRKPVMPPSSNAETPAESVWATRAGTSVAPAWLSIEDDPRETSFEGKTLAGHYEVDDEAVPAQPVSIVEKGILKGFLMSREPVRNWNGSNGHGRLPGPYETELAVIGNLFVKAEQPVPDSALKQKLLELVKNAGLKYGLLIRKLDFPSTQSGEELQDLGKQAEKEGFARTVTPPLLAYRVYANGHEELVRGMRFGEFSAKDLRELTAASDEASVFNYINKGSEFDPADAAGSFTLSSVVCPSLLFESVETRRAEGEVRKPPVVAPPALSQQ